MDVGKRIEKLRKLKRLMQKDLAEELHFSKYQISDWEVGRSLPDLNQIIVIAVFFGVSTDYLLGLEKDETYLNGKSF
ncbi:MAG: helix-turn-helix domain-containing protein [Clostridiales bacterium]|jgi:transcriptional regulator with XRE-family HTH domain|nr:helix-turn-helix domain-containing protein [Clostridiales bacterium]